MRRPFTGVGAVTGRVGSPLQLAAVACSFLVAGYAGARLLHGHVPEVVLWFVGAALLHDLVLLPLYAAVDRALVLVLAAVHRRESALYLRVPAALSGLLLVVWFPMVSGRSAARYRSATGLPADGFLARWLLITAALFAGSGALLGLRLWRRGRCARSATKQRPPAAH